MKTLVAKRLFLGLCLLFGLAAICFAAWSWRQATRPGRVHFERGLDYASAKQMPQAEQEWLSGVREDPNFPDNQAQLGDLYAAQRRFPEAAARYRTAARLMPRDATLFQRLVRVQDASGDLAASLDTAGRVAALHPGDAGVIGDYGIRAATLNQPTRAVPPLKRAHFLAPDNADFLIYLVRAEMQMQDLTGAERDLTPFLARHPDNAEACFLMASLLHQKPQTAENSQAALAYARHAQAGAPRNTDASVLLGQVLLDARQPGQALGAFQQALARTPNSISALHGMLSCETLLGQTAQVTQTRATLTAALARHVRMGHASDLLLANPNDTAAALEMARLREENGEPAQAESYYRRAVRHAPQDAQARTELAGFLRRTRRQGP